MDNGGTCLILQRDCFGEWDHFRWASVIECEPEFESEHALLKDSEVRKF